MAGCGTSFRVEIVMTELSDGSEIDAELDCAFRRGDSGRSLVALPVMHSETGRAYKADMILLSARFHRRRRNGRCIFDSIIQ